MRFTQPAAHQRVGVSSTSSTNTFVGEQHVGTHGGYAAAGGLFGVFVGCDGFGVSVRIAILAVVFLTKATQKIIEKSAVHRMALFLVHIRAENKQTGNLETYICHRTFTVLYCSHSKVAV